MPRELRNSPRKPARQPAPSSARKEAAEHGSALEKALSVVSALVDQSHPIGLADLARALDLPRQTVHRQLRQLEELGCIVRDPAHDRFAVGPRLTSLALRALASHNQGAPVRALLADLVEASGETCNIGLLDGLDFLYIERIECSWSLRVHLTAGSRVPAHCTSGGKVMLAAMDADLRTRLLSGRHLAGFTPTTITRVDKLERELEVVRRRGFALNDQEYTVGIVGVAVPISSADGRVVAALAMHGPAPRLSLAEAEAQVPRLVKSAARIAEAWGLGARPARKRSIAAE